MKIVVTGGAGFIGSHLVDQVLSLGHDVVVLDALRSPVHETSVAPPYLNPLATLMIGEINDRQVLRAAMTGADVIVLSAAYQDYRPDYSTYFHVNAESVALLFEVLAELDARPTRLVFVSSQSVYGEGFRICPVHSRVPGRPRPLSHMKQGDWNVYCPLCTLATSPAPMQEDDAVEPSSVYGLSKRAGEIAVLRLAELHELNAVVIRPSIVIGPRQSPRNQYSGACRAFATALLDGRPCVVNEDGRQSRDFVGVQDVVNALLLALFHKEPPRILNVGGERAVSVLDLLREVERAVGRTATVHAARSYRAGDSRDAISDVRALRNLGWEPKQSLQDAVGSYVNWLVNIPLI